MKTSLTWRNWDRSLPGEADRDNRFLFFLVGAFRFESFGEIAGELSSSAALSHVLDQDYLAVKVDADAAPEVPAYCGFSSLPAAAVVSPDGTVEARLYDLDPGHLMKTLKTIAAGGARHRLGDRPGLGRLSVPYVPERGQGLDRGLEVLEAARKLIEGALGGYEGRPGADAIEPLRFLLKYGIYTNDQDIHRTVRKSVHSLAASPSYDPVEGGFFQGGSDRRDGTAKLLRTNADGLILALRLSRDPEAAFARPLAQGILHYMQTHLMQDGGAFGHGQRADASYYALSVDERRKVVPPPVDRRVFSGANASAVRALCKGWQYLGESGFLDMAVRTYGYLKDRLETGDGTMARWALDGKADGGVYLEDQVDVGYAALSLYQSTLENSYLDDLRGLARRVARDFANPAGVGLLDRRLPLGEDPDGLSPLVDPVLNARAAGFLIVASGQTGEYELAAPAHRILSVLARDLRVLEDAEGCSHLGYALLPLLYPPAVFTAVTDGSDPHKQKVLERIREMDIPFAFVIHRPPSRIETMQPLPRLYVQCGYQKQEMKLP